METDGGRLGFRAEPAPARRRRGRTRGSETTRPPLRGSAAETTRSTSTERSRKVRSRRRVPRSGVRPLRRRAARRRRGAGKCAETTRPPLRGSAAETTRSTSTERSRKVRSRRRVPRSGVRPLRRRAARRRRGAGKCALPPPSPGASGPAPSARQAIPRGTVASSLILRVRSSRQLSRRRHGDEEDGPVVLRRRVPRSGVRPLRRRAARRRRGAGKCARDDASPAPGFGR
ncbi:Hypothetical predicted protein [Xyrichtys novacula]|uniref:Uncharacterized protein n=1 Tax=Xyrichtys novacula TaxID=13765 RepID=A0AAV1FPU6_XYRNO|nr:Hypothetical predicted protein [Xyrichtys novacula]